MSDLLPYVVVGVTTGSVYAIASMGLVLTYKTSGVLNFAHGALAAVGASVFFELTVRSLDLPWPLAALIAVATVGVGGGLALELVARTIVRATPATRIVSSVGLLLVLQGVVALRYDNVTQPIAPFLPTSTFALAGVNVGYDQLVVVVLAAAFLGGLTVFFRRTRLGVAMRAVVDDPELLGLAGTDPTRVRQAAWVVGSSFAAISGLLVAPGVGVDANVLTLLVVQAFGAAAIGAFTSLPRTYVGALVIGVGAALSTKYVVQVPSLQGLPQSLPFIVLFGVLALLPRSRLPVDTLRGRGPVDGERRRRWFSDRQRVAGMALLFVALAIVPTFSGAKTPVFTSGLVSVIQLLSLGLLVRLSGQVSLCHLGFGAVGAAAFSQLATGLGLPWLVALLVAGLFAVPVGALVAVPAIRLSGLYLAIATFGFGILLERLLYPTSFMFGTTSGGVPTPRPGVLGLDSDTGYYLVVLACTLMAVVAVLLVERSRLGRLLRAMADSPTALATHGATVNITKVLVFCLSAYLAAIAGALSGPIVGRASGAGFQSFGSLLLLVLILISGRGTVSAPFLAAVFLVLPTYTERLNFLADYQQILFGLAALAVGLGGARTAAAPTGRCRRAPGEARSPARARLLAARAT